MIDAALLDCEQIEGGVHALTTRPDLGSRIDLVPLYELERTELSAYRGLLVGLHADQRFLAMRRAQLEAFLSGGGTIVVCGHVAHSFLAELKRFRPIPDYTTSDLVVRREVEHPVWAGVNTEDLTWRRGVAGFYGRGANPPPEGAAVIHTLGPGRHPVDFECRPGVGGRLLVHAGADLWGYLEASNTAARMAPQLLDWIRTGSGGDAS
jgi:hypothetical protein